VRQSGVNLGDEIRHGPELELASEAGHRQWPAMRRASRDTRAEEQGVEWLAGGGRAAASVSLVAGLAGYVVEHGTQARVRRRGCGHEFDLEFGVSGLVASEAQALQVG